MNNFLKKTLHIPKVKPVRFWLDMQVRLSVNEAAELGKYMKEHGIEYKITEGSETNGKSI